MLVKTSGHRISYEEIIIIRFERTAARKFNIFIEANFMIENKIRKQTEFTFYSNMMDVLIARLLNANSYFNNIES